MIELVNTGGAAACKNATSVQPFSVADFDGKIVPEREWCVRNFIPHRTVTLISGDGGVGKTQLALQLCAAKATNTNWLGLETRPGRTLFVSAEDDVSELHRRMLAIRLHLGVSWPELGEVNLWPLLAKMPCWAASTRTRRR